MKLVLEKAWDWNDQALMYFDTQRPVMEKFPFWWYHIENNEIRLIKQVSKNFGVIFAENRWIPEVEDEQTTVSNLQKYLDQSDLDVDTLSELERRSWMTLGEFNIEDYPLEQIVEYPSGGGAIFTFHPMLKRIIKIDQCNADGELIYTVRVEYKEEETKNDKNEVVGKRYFKSKTTTRSKIYQCESEQKKEWKELPNGKFIKQWVFRENINGKWTDQTEKYEKERRKIQYL